VFFETDCLPLRNQWLSTRSTILSFSWDLIKIYEFCMQTEGKPYQQFREVEKVVYTFEVDQVSLATLAQRHHPCRI